MKYIIEHLEPRLYKWSLLEYKHISEIVGKKDLIFTNIKTSFQKNKRENLKNKFSGELRNSQSKFLVSQKSKGFLRIHKDKLYEQLKYFGKIYEKSFKNLKLKNVCVLDPSSKRTLSPKDRFDYLVFGGILGDYPRKKRTKKIIGNFNTRNLGKKQFSTDNAVYVAKQISEGKRICELKFKDGIEISFKDCSVILPFKYVLVNKKPLLPDKFIEYIKKKGF